MSPGGATGSLPCHHTAHPDRASPAQGPGHLSGVASGWEFLSLSFSFHFSYLESLTKLLLRKRHWV